MGEALGRGVGALFLVTAGAASKPTVCGPSIQ